MSANLKNLCQARQIHQSQIQNIWTVYPERYRQLANTFVLPSHSERLLLNLLPYFVEISESFVDVEKLAPFRIWRCGW